MIMEEWQVAIIEIRADLRRTLSENSKFKEWLIFILLSGIFALAGLQQFGGP